MDKTGRGAHRQPKAYEDTRFLRSKDARALRILAEYLEPLYRFQRHNILLCARLAAAPGSTTRMTERHDAHLVRSHVAQVIRATMPKLGLIEPSPVCAARNQHQRRRA